jgi:PKD repeat protein
MVIEKLTSYDAGYTLGDLSLFPQAIDSWEQLYEAKNLSITKTSQYLSYAGEIIIVENTDSFPDKGILKLSLPNYVGLNSELIYYNAKTSNTFYELIRGFCSPRQDQYPTAHIQSEWPISTKVEAGVMAEHHNAVKDAIYNMETYLGVKTSTSTSTLTGLLKKQEAKILAPKALFRAYPTSGTTPLTVTFHSFTASNTIRYFWDFGDGAVSFDKNPTHTYSTEGNYTIQLRTITSLGAQGFTTKRNYISVSNQYAYTFFYASPNCGISTATANSTSVSATSFTIIDQTNAEIINRLWEFGDGKTYFAEDPNEHVAYHTYENPGCYEISLSVELKGQQILRVFNKVIVKVV